MAGRPRRSTFDELHYELRRYKRKYSAFCKVCKKSIQNTADCRLRSHRRSCRFVTDDGNGNGDAQADASKVDAGVPLPLEMECEVTTSLVSYQGLETRTSQQSIVKKDVKVKNVNEMSDVNTALARLIFACNIPLNVVDSCHFKTFIEKLNPSYLTKLPNHTDLSTTLLDDTYDRCVAAFKASLGEQSVLLIEDWKNCTCNDKIVVSALRNDNAEQAFVEAWYLVTEDSVSSERLIDMVIESLHGVENVYTTNVYAVVSNNTNIQFDMKLGDDHSVWHVYCNNHIANLFAADILNRDLNAKVISVLEEFNRTDFEKIIVEMGGSSVKLPRDTDCCLLYRNAYKCLLDNAQYMKIMMATPNLKEIAQDVAELIDSKEFIDQVEENFELLEPICRLIRRCQKRNAFAAEAASLWLNLTLPEKYQWKFVQNLQRYSDMALNEFALSAYFLHPHYDNSILSTSQRERIYTFLFKNLDGSAIEDSYSFIQKTGYFKHLYEKNIRNPLAFWSVAEMKYPALAKLASKLLKLPATSVQVRKTFPNWAYGRSESHNSLTSEQYRKLLYNSYMLAAQDIDNDTDNEIVKDIAQKSEKPIATE